MSLPPLMHTGSVKDIRGEAGAKHLVFEYSDRYSVFDWGEMPDHLPGKGQALAFMAHAFFDLLEEPHHGVGLVDQQMSPLERHNPGRFYQVQAVQVLYPQFSNGVWNYDVYQKRPVQTLVPLEIIFRFGIPSGSSLLERAKDADYLKQLGLNAPVRPGQVFDRPVIEWSSKLESSDRYIPPAQAREMAGMSPSEFKRLEEMSIRGASKLHRLFADLGLELWDGKFEFAFREGDQERDFMFVDSIGPDELRLLCDGVQLSKENLRERYRGGSWHQAVEQSKALAKERGLASWKDICQNELNSGPPRLAAEELTPTAMIYKTLANELAKKHFSFEVFPEAWSLEQLVRNLR